MKIFYFMFSMLIVALPSFAQSATVKMASDEMLKVLSNCPEEVAKIVTQKIIIDRAEAIHFDKDSHMTARYLFSATSNDKSNLVAPPVLEIDTSKDGGVYCGSKSGWKYPSSKKESVVPCSADASSNLSGSVVQAFGSVKHDRATKAVGDESAAHRVDSSDAAR